jgi:hypothetical protein
MCVRVNQLAKVSSKDDKTMDGKAPASPSAAAAPRASVSAATAAPGGAVTALSAEEEDATDDNSSPSTMYVNLLGCYDEALKYGVAPLSPPLLCV